MKLFAIGILRVSIRYTFTRDGWFFYQRPVPRDLIDRYGKKTIKKPLHTKEPEVAAGLVAKENRLVEAEWSKLRSDPETSPAALKAHAETILRDWGLSPKAQGLENDPQLLEWLGDQLDDRRARHVERAYDRDDWETAYTDIATDEYLTPAEIEALRLLRETPKDTITSALAFYLQRHPKGATESITKAANFAVEQFVAAVGDKEFTAVSRADVHQWMEWAVAKGQSQGTIERRINSLRAIFGTFIREKELNIPNRFEKHTIPSAAKAAEKRETFTDDNLRMIQDACKELSDDVRWMIGMMSDTGARLAEIAGLRLEDLAIDEPVPFVNIEPHAGRPLKTPQSKRKVPLVGVALWAATEIKANAKKGQVFAFPRYIKDGMCMANKASATINKWIRSKEIDHTGHEFRHTMKDRLRDVGCPKEVQDQIGGWAKADIAEGYGKGYTLTRMQEWLEKVVLNRPGN